MEKVGARLLVRTVQDSIDKGRVAEEKGVNPSRNGLQTVTLLDALEELRADAAIGGGRRDEEKARAKERFFSHRDEFGQWDPKNQRPELWNIFNGRLHQGDKCACSRSATGPRWTCGNTSRRRRSRFRRSTSATSAKWSTAAACFWPTRNSTRFLPGEKYENRTVRFRTVGDATCTGAVESPASTLEEIIAEVAAARQTERGTRADDKRSENAMEDRKKVGYF